MMSSRSILGLVFAAAMTLSSCTGAEEPPPPPTTSTRTTATTPRPSVAPQVEEAIDLRPHRRHSCVLLSPQQLDELGFPPQEFEGANVKSGVCEWSQNNSQEGNIEEYIYMLSVYVTGDPLAEAYRYSNSRLDSGGWRWPMFETRTVRGLPAVVYSVGNSATFCEVVVSTGGGQGIEFSGALTTDYANPRLCNRVITAAELVIDNVRK